MKYSVFFVRLIILTIIMVVIVAALNYVSPLFEAFEVFTWITLLFFFLITALIFYFGLKAIKTENAYRFVSIINGSVLVKILLCGFFIMGYALLVKPKDVLFIIPFFFFYIVYTVFEIRELIMADNYERALKKNG
ncbi:MAG: hypothetical protein H0W62_12665 [Chitinophagales bacterium]|nr:hypothetical protein [Chitinophagales bacterium]